MKEEVWIKINEDGIVRFGGMCKAKNLKKQFKMLKEAGLK
tara:strand:- start:1782 stop:1901 length:120 start_codon:yes stop_codon:yes gene_type:complete